MASNEEIYSRIGAVEGAFRTFTEELRDDRRRMKDDIDINARDIQKVSSRQNWMLGVASGLSMAAGAVGAMLTHMLQRPQV